MKKDKDKGIPNSKKVFELLKSQKGAAYLDLCSIVLPCDFPVTSVIWDPLSIALVFAIPESKAYFRAVDYSDSSDWATKDTSAAEDSVVDD
jgi:hypothetical protein